MMKNGSWLSRMRFDEDILPLYYLSKIPLEKLNKGAFAKEWNSYNDIGFSFNGKKLSLNEYLQVENSYISCIKELAIASGCDHLNVSSITIRGNFTVKKEYFSCAIDEIDETARRALRDKAEVILYNKDNSFLVEFKVDFLACLRTILDIRIITNIINSHHLYLISRQLKDEIYGIPSFIDKLLDSSYHQFNRFVIVKYRPEYYLNNKYKRDEWTSFCDVGKRFRDGKLTMEKYLQIENRFISCAKELAEKAGCGRIMIGYIEGCLKLRIKKSNGKVRMIQRGSYLCVNDLDDVLRKVLREEFWIVFINKTKHFMIDFGYDYYMHIRCKLGLNSVRFIVNKNGLYLDPRHLYN